MKAGKIVLLVLGIILLILSLIPLLVGGGLMWAEKALRDSEGFYTTPAIQVEKDSYAIVTEPINIDIGEDWEWVFRGRHFSPSNFLALNIQGFNNNSSKQIFLGIAEASELEAYLENVEYDEITAFKIHRHNMEYTDHPGTSSVEAPTTQTFWITSAYGQGRQTLEWSIEEGTYSLVLMNGDGSRGLDLAISVGVKLPLVVGWIGIVFLVVGLVLLGVAILMVYLGVRRPKLLGGESPKT